MKTKLKETNNILPLKRNKLSFAVLVALGAISNQPYVQAGPGAVCSDGISLVIDCPKGATIPTYYANSPTNLRKFVDTLPGLTSDKANNFGSYIPIAHADTTSYLGSAYYELAVVEYTQKMHSDLQKATTLRGYVQIDRETTNKQTPGIDSNDALSLKYPDRKQIFVAKEKGYINGGVWDHTLVKDNLGKPIMVAAIAVDTPHYLGPMIKGLKGQPTRIKMNNLLPKGHATGTGDNVERNGDMFLPVDESLPGAGDSPIIDNGTTLTFPQNRVAIHLHGGDSPWISDGTPHQWFSAETDPDMSPLLKRGDRTFNVPDMPYPGEAAQTLFWPNDQSGRLMWYHDHTFGITRQNAYVGMAAGYLISDPTEEAALSSAVPTDMIPLILQDKTFVPDDIASQDSKWDQAHWGKPGDLWYPHVYEPNILSDSDLTPNPAGRWDFGPTESDTLIPSILDVPDGTYGHVSVGPEAYMDTPVVNGVAYPTVTVEPKPYRVKLLNGANDRYFNLSLWVADSDVTSSDGRTNTEVKMVPEVLPVSFTIRNGGAGYVAPIVTIIDDGGYGSGAVATATVDANGKITSITLTPDNPGSGYSNPKMQITDTVEPTVSPDIELVTGTGRLGGIPDPANAGPDIIQFGNETGVLPKPVVYKPKAMNLLATDEEVNNGGGFYLGNAERADTVIDFSQYAGQTLILYNDSTAPIPGGDNRYDYFTGNDDLRPTGGADKTLAGYGPNTRTVMQIKVAPLAEGAATPAAYDPTGNGGALETVLPNVYANSADKAIVTGIVADGQPTSSLLEDWKVAHGITINNVKTIEGGFDVNFGRLIANFGVELTGPGSKPTPLAYIDTATDIVEDRQIQYWQIKNNDADNHPIHFHLFNVQVLARVDQATGGTIINPTPDEAGWKETVQNWPGQDVIVALKPKTPELPFGLPDSVRLMDPTLAAGDTTNKSLDQNYTTGIVDPSNIPFAFQQYDLAKLLPDGTTNPNYGLPLLVDNDTKNYGWEYTFHCHILGHEENDLMRPMKFLPIPTLLPTAPTNVAMDTHGKVSWTDATPISNDDTKGNPANEIGFRIEYAPKINGNVGTFVSATSIDGKDPFTIIPDIARNLQASATSTVNALANSQSFDADISALTPNTDFIYQVVAVNQKGEAFSSTTLEQATAKITDLSISAILPRSLTLNWTDHASNEDGFIIESSIDNGVTWLQKGTVLKNITSYQVTGLTPDVLYQFRVGSSKHKFDTQFNTTPVEARTAPELLASVFGTPISSAVNGIPQIALAWSDNSVGETAYWLERCNGTTAQCSLQAAVWTTVSNNLPAGSTSFIDTTVSAAATYVYRVRAQRIIDGVTTEAPIVKSAQVTAGVVVSSPSNLTANSTNGASVILNWTDTSTNETSFKVERAPLVNGVPGTFIVLPAGTVTRTAALGTAINGNVTFTDATAVVGSSYAYQVRAIRLAGGVTSASAASNQANISLTLSAPASLTGVQNGTGILLSWLDTSNNETGFQLARSVIDPLSGSPQGSATFVTITSTASQKTAANAGRTYTDATVLPGNIYSYSIAAVNGSATSTIIAMAPNTIALPPMTAPSTPTAVITNGTRITVSWTDLASNETGFLVERKIGGGDWTAQPTLGAAQTGVGKVVNYVDNLVTPIAYGPYQYRVSAISGTAAPFKASSPSVLSAPLEFSLPTAPTNIIATPGTVGTVNVSWSDNALNETGFTLQRATNSTFTAGLVSTKIGGANSLGTFNYLVTNLKSKTNYYFRAQATNAVGGSSFSTLTGSVKAP